MNQSVKYFIKVVGGDILLAIIAVFLYSPGYLGLHWDAFQSLSSVFFCTSLVVLVWCFIMNTFMLHKMGNDVVLYKTEDLESIKDYKEVLEKIDPKCFGQDIDTVKWQLDRLEGKVDKFYQVLKSLFKEEEMTYKQFSLVVEGTKQVFLKNVSQIINRVNVFDYADYKYYKRKHEWQPLPELYTDSIQYVSSLVEKNNVIIYKIDELIQEVSKLTESSVDLEKIPAISELNELIENTKYYERK